MNRAAPWLNIDLGELDDEPEGLYAAADIANIACGGHAGDERSMRRALRQCLLHGVAAGAHPSFPDRENFGRVRLALAPSALRASVAEQCDRLATLADEEGLPLRFVKPHGALYHAANDDPEVARAVVAAAIESLGHGVVMIGPPRGHLRAFAEDEALAFAAEGFADRATRDDGTLVPRSERGALVTEPAAAAAQARALLGRGGFVTLCVHGDTPGAEAIARAVRDVVDAARSAGGA
jgi:UPF0271 protein